MFHHRIDAETSSNKLTVHSVLKQHILLNHIQFNKQLPHGTSILYPSTPFTFKSKGLDCFFPTGSKNTSQSVHVLQFSRWEFQESKLRPLTLWPCVEFGTCIYIEICRYIIKSLNVQKIIYLYIHKLIWYTCTFTYVLKLTTYRGTQCAVFTSLERFGIVIGTTKEVCFPILACFTKLADNGTCLQWHDSHGEAFFHAQTWHNEATLWMILTWQVSLSNYQNPKKSQCSQAISPWRRLNNVSNVEKQAPCGFDSCHPKPHRKCQSQTDFGRTLGTPKNLSCGKTDKIGTAFKMIQNLV